MIKFDVSKLQQKIGDIVTSYEHQYAWVWWCHLMQIYLLSWLIALKSDVFVAKK